MFGGMKGFLNPTPETRKENANYLKAALGVTDEEKYALYDLLFWLIDLHDGQIEDDKKADLKLKASYDLIGGVYDALQAELDADQREDDDDDL